MLNWDCKSEVVEAKSGDYEAGILERLIVPGVCLSSSLFMY